MKLIFSNGRKLEIRDVGPIIVSFHMQNIPLKYNGFHLVEDEKAQAEMRSLINSKLYRRIDKT